jgi:hypothetical protein
MMVMGVTPRPETGPARAVFCASSPEAAMLSDGEFWDRVFNRGEPTEPPQPTVDDIERWELQDRMGGPCPECGEVGACAYDDEGRALVHLQPLEADEPVWPVGSTPRKDAVVRPESETPE